MSERRRGTGDGHHPAPARAVSPTIAVDMRLVNDPLGFHSGLDLRPGLVTRAAAGGGQ